MCGICGIVVGEEDVAPMIVDALTSLQHRGQDAAGMAVTSDAGRTLVRKGNGLVADVFKEERDVQQLLGRVGVGHVRYPTAGSSDFEESQPFYCNYPWGCALAHNGNLTNVDELRHYCRTVLKRQINTGSDSELILAVFAHELAEAYDGNREVSSAAAEEAVFRAVTKCMTVCQGAYAIVVGVTGVGVVGFRDPHGIRPLCYGERPDGAMLSSESVAIDINGFTLVRDVRPGEAVLLRADNDKPRVCVRQCFDAAAAEREPTLSPCIFEFVYFARPDSVIDGASVYEARVRMGDFLAKRIQETRPGAKIDVVVPVPSTSRVSAVQCAIALGVPYAEGLVRNRYTQRTFIMPGQKKRKKGVRLKLNPVTSVLRNRAVLLVDDSIVRGTTSKHIVEMVRAAGASAVYFASAAPAVRFPNVYGIDMPSRMELIAHGRDEDQVAEAISADWVVYQTIDDLVASVRSCNPQLTSFDCSCFNGVYCAGDLPDAYFEKLHAQRNDAALTSSTVSVVVPGAGASGADAGSGSKAGNGAGAGTPKMGADRHTSLTADPIMRYASPFHANRVDPTSLRANSTSPRFDGSSSPSSSSVGGGGGMTSAGVLNGGDAGGAAKVSALDLSKGASGGEDDAVVVVAEDGDGSTEDGR